jgi:hypothetical protein
MSSEQNPRDERRRWRSPWVFSAVVSLARLIYQIFRDWHRL